MKIITNVLRAVFLFATIILSSQVFATETVVLNNAAAIQTVTQNQEVTLQATATPDSFLAQLHADSQKPAFIRTMGDDAGSSMRGKVNWLLVIIAILLFMVIVLVLDILGVVGELQGKPVINWTSINSILFMAFLVIGMGAAFWEYGVHARLTVNAQPAAAEHGAVYDSMFNITFILTGIVFVITQVLLFWYAYKYKHSNKRKALFYPDNHKLELIWTVIPAIVLTVLVIRGLKTWNEIMYHKDEKAQVIEVFGYQFAWNARYAGEDNKLGSHDFRQIGVVNALGVNPKDSNAQDDIVVNEMHLKVGQPVVLKFRAKDVIHSAYLPHFRVQMNVVPGLPTQFAFTPTLTTQQMREQLKDPKFDYALLCNKICGSAHYRMKMKVVVDSPADYDKWISAQPKLVQAETPAAAPAADSAAVAAPAEHAQASVNNGSKTLASK